MKLDFQVTQKLYHWDPLFYPKEFRKVVSEYETKPLQPSFNLTLVRRSVLW